MHVRLTPRGRELCKILGKAGAGVAGFLLAIQILALIFHGIGTAFSSPHVQAPYTPPRYTSIQNWARTYPPPTPATPQTPSSLMPTQPTEPLRITYRPNPIVMPQLTTTQSQPQRQDNPPLAPYQPPDSSVILIGNVAYSPLSTNDVALAPDAAPLGNGQPVMTRSLQQNFASPPLRFDATVKRNLAAIYREFLQQREVTRLAIGRERQVQTERIAAERREQDVRGRQSQQDAERHDGGTVRPESVEQRDRDVREREDQQRREAEARQQTASRNQTHGSHSDRDASQNPGR
jgi:hypothetical protein